MASIRRYRDGRIAIVGDYCNGSPFVRHKWVHGEKSHFSSGLDFGDGDVPLHSEERSPCLDQKQHKYVDD